MGKKQTRRERLQVPLDVEVLDALQDFADFSNRSRANIASEIITEAVPALYQLTKAMERLEISPSTAILKVAELADKLSWEAKQASLDLEEEFRKGT